MIIFDHDGFQKKVMKIIKPLTDKKQRVYLFGNFNNDFNCNMPNTPAPLMLQAIKTKLQNCLLENAVTFHPGESVKNAQHDWMFTNRKNNKRYQKHKTTVYPVWHSVHAALHTSINTAKWS